MTDLEDRILKQNIPGKYSSWHDDDDDDEKKQLLDVDENDFNHSEEEEDIDNDDGCNPRKKNNTPLVQSDWKQARKQDGSKTLQVETLEGRQRQTRRGAKNGSTGVKGVLNDYRTAREEEKQRRTIERLEREEIWKRTTQGATLRPGELAMSAAATEERLRSERRVKEVEWPSWREEETKGDDNGDDDDEEFLERYRRQRVQQLRAASSWPVYGEIREATPTEYIDVIDSTDHRVMVIVHLYEPFVSHCNTLNRYLEELARTMSFARFVRLRALEASKTFDLIGLPAVVMYKGGKLVHNLTRVTEHLPDKFTKEDVQWLLESCGAVNPHSVEATTTTTTTGSSLSNISTRENAFVSVTNGNGIQTVSAGCSIRRFHDEEYDSDDAELDEFCKGFESSV